MSQSLTEQAADEETRRRLAVLIQFVQLAGLYGDQLPEVLHGSLAQAQAAIRLEPVPLSPLDRRCADALADEVAALVRRGIIDSRSPAADALLDYRNPPSTPRADRLAELEKSLRDTRQAFTESVTAWQAQTIVRLFDKILGDKP